MNDRFKFRVWSNKNNIYIVDSHYPIGSDHSIVIRQDGKAYNLGLGDYEDYSNMHSWAVMEEFTDCIIEQCTGLKDKNGNLIYEGDVVQFTHNRGYFTNKGDIRVIEFSAFRFCGFGWRSHPENNVEFALTESAAKKCVVIGNIHEQAEQKDVK